MDLKLGNNELLLMVVFKIMCLFCAGCIRMSNTGGKNAGKRIPNKISVDQQWLRNNEKRLEEYVREWPKHPGLIETKWKPERSHKKDKVKHNNNKNK